MPIKMVDIINIQEYILYYGEQVINTDGMFDMDDISEQISLLLNELLFIISLIEK